MFSGIRDFLRTVGVARDPQMQPHIYHKPAGERDARRGDDSFTDDDTLFSIAAIRALLTTEPLPDDLAAVLGEDEKAAILKGLTELEAQGIHNIPLRLNQSILDAVRAALPAR